MNDFIKSILRTVAAGWFRIIIFFLKTRRNQTAYVFDIDNTIADTWPSLVAEYPSERTRLLTLEVFEGMQKIIMNLQSRNIEIFYLSNRSVLSYLVTIRWLRLMGFQASVSNVMLVNAPVEKIRILEKLSAKRRIKYIDDLAYGHESGAIKLYVEVIEKLSSLRLRHFGKNVVDRINSRQKKDK